MRLLPLITSMSQIHTPDPNAPPEEYRRAVAASIQDLVAGRRPRDPALSGASTGRLILEGVVESVKVYRLYQQEKMSKVSEVRRGERDRGGTRDGKRHHRPHRHGQRSPTDNASSHENRQRRRHTPAEEQASNSVHDHNEQEHDQRGHHTPENHLETHPTHHLMSDALHAAESVLDHGPDGTPFGLLPTRGKGVGWMPHVKAVHRHIVAEQEAGLRSKGLAEKCVGAFLQKRRAARGGEEGKGKGKEKVVEEVGMEGDEGGGVGGRGSRKLRKRRGGRQAGIGERALHMSDGDGPSGKHEVHPPHQPALSARDVSSRVQSPVEESRTYRDRRGAVVVEEKNAFAEARSETPYVPVVRFQSPTPHRELTPIRLPGPRGSHERRSSDDVVRGSVGESVGESGSQYVPRTPDVPIHSSTPHRQGTPVRLMTPQGSYKSHGSDDVAVPAVERAAVGESVEGCGSQDAPYTPIVPIQSSTPHRQTTPVRLMTPQESHSHHDREGVAGGKALEEKTAIEDSVERSGSQVTPCAPIVRTQSSAAPERMTPVRLPTPASQVTSSISPASSLLPMFLLDEESEARPEEAHLVHSHFEAPVYEATPHSTDVEALEHAQAVEEMERRQEAESHCRTETPLTAPQPKVALPTSFGAELVETAHLMNLTKQDDSGLHKAPENCKSPQTERKMEDSNPQPEDEDLIDLTSNRCPSSDSWTNRDAGTRKPIWGQGPDWNFDNLNKRAET